MTNRNEAQEQRMGRVLGHLEALLDLENEKIGKDSSFDLAASSTAKSRCLFEITTLLRHKQNQDEFVRYQDQLSSVQNKLSLNKQKLEIHMEAVRGIADLIKDTVKNAEDDGTYSMGQFGAYEIS